MNYTFSTLNDKEFEQISRDLLNAKFGMELQHFKSGRDNGIDLRYSTPKNNNDLVVQVKHYIHSAYAQLKHALLIKELDKVKKLSPRRYLVVTSLSLSAKEKDELKTGLSPFVLSANDIIGQEDLNNYLSEFKEIEKKHFKLWFSSIAVFNAVINNAVEGRTRYMLEKIMAKIPFYVITKKLDEANGVLQKEKLLLITGQPGIGKTTLAEIILFERAKNGYSIYKVENITEAEQVLSMNDDEKQLFYFDDFLGANYFEIINAHKTETQLTSFIERVKNTPNKYLILTTRTVILNQAIEKYEKISRSKLSNQQFEIKLLDYNLYEKALILYNHIYFRKLRDDLHLGLLENDFYKLIIKDKNYTPRIIEFITDSSRVNDFNSEQYHQFILNNLKNPKEIWRYSFNNQIDYLDRCFLLTLFTFDQGASEQNLISSFDIRLQYERDEHNQIITTDQLNDSIKILLNGFITVNLLQILPPLRSYAFINPSLADFLIGHIQESFAERKSILSSVIYIEQLKRFHPGTSSIPLEKELQIVIRDRIENNLVGILADRGGRLTNNQKSARYLDVLCSYCKDINVDRLTLKYFQALKFEESWTSIYSLIDGVLLKLGDAPETIDFIKNNFLIIIEKLASAIDSRLYALEIPHYFEIYDQDYERYVESEEGFSSLIDMMDNVLRSSEEELRLEKTDEIASIDEASEIYNQISEIEGDLKSELFPGTNLYHDFGIGLDEEYWNEIIASNRKRDGLEEDDYEDHYFRDPDIEISNENQMIEDLFSKADQKE